MINSINKLTTRKSNYIDYKQRILTVCNIESIFVYDCLIKDIDRQIVEETEKLQDKLQKIRNVIDEYTRSNKIHTESKT